MEDLKSIPYFVHEGEMARAERSRKRMIVALIVSLVVTAFALGALFVNNQMWMSYVATIEAQSVQS